MKIIINGQEMELDYIGKPTPLKPDVKQRIEEEIRQFTGRDDIEFQYIPPAF